MTKCIVSLRERERREQNFPLKLTLCKSLPILFSVCVVYCSKSTTDPYTLPQNTVVVNKIDLKWRVISKGKSFVELWEQHKCLLPKRMAPSVVGHCRFPIVGHLRFKIYDVSHIKAISVLAYPILGQMIEKRNLSNFKICLGKLLFISLCNLISQ